MIVFVKSAAKILRLRLPVFVDGFKMGKIVVKFAENCVKRGENVKRKTCKSSSKIVSQKTLVLVRVLCCFLSKMDFSSSVIIIRAAKMYKYYKRYIVSKIRYIS